jgi:hypothetical protein
LKSLECDLINQYEDIRNKEALLWKQKSREKWVQDGDRNTKFFHLTTMVRRRRNKIDGLFDIHGNWCENHEVMKTVAKDFFQDLFAAKERPDSRFIIPFLFPDVDCSVALNLAVAPQEIKKALFSIGSLKAPGFDGFPSLFYHKHWDICGHDIIQLVTSAFSSGCIPKGLNHSLLTLIPKTHSPKHMHLFRPISLCCTIYKVITKVIVARIRPFLQQWISPNQVSYVPGRNISDNIMITQEILHKCKITKGEKSFLVNLEN